MSGATESKMTGYLIVNRNTGMTGVVMGSGMIFWDNAHPTVFPSLSDLLAAVARDAQVTEKTGAVPIAPMTIHRQIETTITTTKTKTELLA